MLSVPTLWTVFCGNFLAMGLVWIYVLRSYPTFHAARYWAAGCILSAAGAALGLLRALFGSGLPLLGGGILIIVACCLIAMGIRRFYHQPAGWRTAGIITGLSVGGIVFFSWFDSMPMRILFYSLAQAIPIALVLGYLWSRDGRRHPGARMAGIVAVAIIAVHVVRASAALLRLGDVSMVSHSYFQAALVLVLVFLAMSWNFAFLLMAIDRLRTEVENLALLDDLTGVANRRHLLQRLSAQCELSRRTGESFALLAIDLDGFKEINDGHGHAAGDECLRQFTRAAQARLRPGDLLARTGGDEFCVMLPATTLREGAMIARQILEECHALCIQRGEESILIAASIGVAQWSQDADCGPVRLIAAADDALYTAKKLGKNRYAVYQRPGPAPELEPLRKIA